MAGLIEMILPVKIPLVSAAALVLALPGCAVQADSPPPIESEGKGFTAPAIDPGPVKLSKKEAGERYLNIVCTTNAAQDVLWNAFKAHEEEYLAGGSPEVETVKSAATEVVRVSRLAVEALDDDYYLWPEVVEEQIPVVRSTYMLELSFDQALMNATTFAEAYNSGSVARSAEQVAAPQEIRYQLGLDADAVGSCVGYEGGLDMLHSEAQEREKALSEQED